VAATPLHLRIFLSSPGDVAEERAGALGVLAELPRSPLLEGKVTIQVAAWDDPQSPVPLSVNETPQASVIRYKTRPAECDLTIVVLWGRLGTVLPPDVRKPDGTAYRSGTEWELDDSRRGGKEAFVYRRTTPAHPDTPEDERQRDRLEAFLAEETRNADGSPRGGINEYGDVATFKELLSRHLQAFVNRRLEAPQLWPRRVAVSAVVAGAGLGVVAWIRARKPPPSPPTPSTIALEGNIIDEPGHSVDGATVSLPELGASTISGPKGHFLIQVSGDEEREVELVVTCAGFPEHRQRATLGNRSLDVRIGGSGP
jgi:hypothetical protein